MPLAQRIRLGGLAAVVGGVLYVVLMTFSTIAHGPKNPAPTDGTFFGFTSFVWGTLAMFAPTPLLVLGLVSLHRWLRPGIVGTAGIYLTFTGFVVVFLAGALGIVRVMGLVSGEAIERAWWLTGFGGS